MITRRGLRTAVVALSVVTVTSGVVGPVAAKPAHPAKKHGVARPVFAVSTHPGADVDEDVAEFRLLKDAGVEQIRADFVWSHIEPDGFQKKPSAYDWAQDDAILAAAKKVGLTVNAVVTYGNVLYSKAGAAHDDDHYPPDRPASFGHFAADVARHVTTKFPGVVSFVELWNEPNFGYSFWKPKTNPKAYARLLCAGYTAVKKATPTMTVSTGGLSMPPAGNSPQITIGGRLFLDQLLTTIGHKTCFDAVAYHPYVYPQVSPEAVVPDNGNASVDTYAAQLRAVLKKHGRTHVPLYNTESGWTTTAEDFPDSVGVTEAMQARYIVRGNLLSWARGVPVVTWYDQFDGSDAATNPDRESHWGLFHTDHTPKPVVAAMTTFAKVLPKGWTYTADLSRALKLPAGTLGVDSGHALEFSGPKGKHVVALWYANENVPSAQNCAQGVLAFNCPVMPELPPPATITATVTLPAGAKSSALTTMYGDRSAATPTIELGQEPVYLSWTGRALS